MSAVMVTAVLNYLQWPVAGRGRRGGRRGGGGREARFNCTRRSRHIGDRKVATTAEGAEHGQLVH
jgi:hypothetical protein